MSFNRKYVNKVVSHIDRYFTYDRRYLRRENTSERQDIFVVRDAEGAAPKVIVAANNTKYGLYVYIRKEEDIILSKILHTPKEVNNFKKMVRCLG